MNRTRICWGALALTLGLFILLTATSALGQESTQKAKGNDEANKRCTGDPYLRWPEVNEETGLKGVVGKPCGWIDQRTKLKVSGKCVKQKTCHAEKYTGLDGKEHPVQDLKNPIPAHIPSRNVDLDEPQSNSPGLTTPLPDASSPLSAFEPREWQGEGDSPKLEGTATTPPNLTKPEAAWTEETYDATTQTRTIREYDDNDNLIRETKVSNADGVTYTTEFDSTGKVSKEVFDYPNGRKTVYDQNPYGSETRTIYDSNGRIEYIKDTAIDGSRRETTHYYIPGTDSPRPAETISELYRSDGTLAERTTTSSQGLQTYSTSPEVFTEMFDDRGNITWSYYVSDERTIETSIDAQGREYDIETLKNFDGQGNNLVVSGNPDDPDYAATRGEIRDSQGKLLGSFETRTIGGQTELWGGKAGQPTRRIVGMNDLKKLIDGIKLW